MSRFYSRTLRGAAFAFFLLILAAGVGCKGVDFFWFEVRELDGKVVYTVHPCIDLPDLNGGASTKGVQAPDGPSDEEPEEAVPGMRGKD
jgi:hypothetical protein